MLLVVGGVAVVLHGHLRTTADLDLVLMTPENVATAREGTRKGRICARAPVLVTDFARPERRRDWIETKGLTVFSLWHPEVLGFELDLLVEEERLGVPEIARTSRRSG